MLTYLQNNFPCEVKTVNNCIAQGSKLEKARILLTWAIPSKKHYMYWKRLVRFKAFNKEYLNFTSEKITADTKDFSEVDCFVCGSDQIWNKNAVRGSSVFQFRRLVCAGIIPSVVRLSPRIMNKKISPIRLKLV